MMGIISRTGRYYLCVCNLRSGHAQGITVRVPEGFDHENFLEEKLDELLEMPEIIGEDGEVVWMATAESFVAPNGMIISKGQRTVAKEFIAYAKMRMQKFYEH